MNAKENLIPLANHFRDGLGVVPREAIKPGLFALANEERFTSGFYSEPLTAYAVGYTDRENIKATLDFIAPEVTVGRRFEFKKLNEKDDFMSETDDVRAIGSAFKRVAFSGTSVNEKTLNKGLTYRIDRDDETISEEQVVASLMKRIYRNDFRRAVTALLALDSSGTGKTWGTSAQPDQDNRAAVAAAQLASGIFPNRALIGLVAWNLRSAAYAAQDNAGAYASMGLTPTQAAQLIGLDDMMVSRELYQSSGTAKTRIMTSNIVFFYAENGVTRDDPTHLKRFVSGVEGGGLVRVFREEIGPKFIDITVEHYSNVVATGTIGAAKLNIS